MARQPESVRAKTGKPVTALLWKASPVLVPVVAFSIVINILRLTVPLYMLQVIDRVLSSESSETLLFLTILAVGAIATSAVLTAASSRVTSAVGAWIDDSFYPAMMARILRIRRQMAGGRATVGLRDLGQLRQLLSGPTLATLLETPWTFVFIGVLYYLHPNLGILAAVAAVLLLCVATLDEFAVQPTQRKAMQAKEAQAQTVERALPDAETVKAMGFHDRLSEDIGRGNGEASKDMDRALSRSSTLQAIVRMLRTWAQIGMLGTGAMLVLQNEITLGTMIAGSILLGLALSPVDKAIGTIASIIRLKGALHRLNLLLGAEEPGVADSEKLVTEGAFTLSLRQAVVIPEGMRKPVLRPVTLDLQAAEVLGIIGPVGSGKTTLIRLMAGIVEPTSGTILLNEVPLARAAGPKTRHHFGYLSQSATALPGSIGQNISRFSDRPAKELDAAIVLAAQDAGIHNAILALPEGYDTPLGTGDDSILSRGQTQQIMIARALFGGPRYLLLDEPSVWLDKSAEDALISGLRRLQKTGTTIIMATQKPSLLGLCDQLVHLRDGLAVDIGPRADVLERVASGDVRGQPRRVRLPQSENRAGEKS